MNRLPRYENVPLMLYTSLGALVRSKLGLTLDPWDHVVIWRIAFVGNRINARIHNE